MQINLLSPATDKGLQNTNSANKTLLMSSVIIWIIIIGGYLALVIFNEFTLKNAEAVDKELQTYSEVIGKVDLNRNLLRELNNKETVIQTLDKNKLIFSKIIKEINSQLPYQVTINQFEITPDTDPEHYKINLHGESPDVKAIAEFQRNLQAFNIGKSNDEKLKYSISKVMLVDQSQNTDHSFYITISIKKEVIVND